MNIWNTIISPMLLDEIDKPFDSDNYIYELKYDGMRALIYANKKEIKIYNRHKQDISYLFPELQNIKKIVNKNTIFDGEIVSFINNKPSFSSLQERTHLKNINKIIRLSNDKPVIFVCFDIIFEGHDLTNLPLIERKKLLNKYEDNEYFIKSFYIENEGIKLFNNIKKKDLEGIVAKKKDDIYEYNTRSKSWIKIKNFNCELFYIGGYVINPKSYMFSALLGEYKKGKFNYVGKVSISKKNNLYKKVLDSKKLNKSPFENYQGKEPFISPDYTCKVKYMERTKNNELRQPFLDK